MAYASINGAWASISDTSLAVERTDTGYKVSVGWKTKGSALKAKASVNGSQVKSKSGSSVWIDFAGSGTKTFAVETEERGAINGSFNMHVACRGTPTKWADDEETVEYVVPPVQYTVHFDANYPGGEDPEDITVGYGEEYGTLPSPTREGYGLIGWFTEAVGGTQITSSSTVGITEDQTLYAHWQNGVVTMSYNANGGKCSKDSDTVEKDSDISDALPDGMPTPTRGGYSFLGWFTQAEGGTEVNGDTHIPANAESFTVYAHWEPMAIFRIVSGGQVKQTVSVWTVSGGAAKQVVSIWVVANGVAKQCI